MARFAPEDIALYSYCPFAYRNKKYNKVVSNLNYIEKAIKDTFIATERRCALMDSFVNKKKLYKSWDKLWWPIAVDNKIDIEKAKEITIKAAKKFTDYCKYDISDYSFQTVGAGVPIIKNINSNIIYTNIDIIKVDFNKKYTNTVVIDFNINSYNSFACAFDQVARIKSYCMYSGEEDLVTYISINISEKLELLKISTASFNKEELNMIGKNIFYMTNLMKAGIFYPNTYLCKECNICKNSI